MKQYYKISYRWYETKTYCSNIAHAENADEVRKHYIEEGHAWVGDPEEASEYELAEAKRRGMPIVEI